MKKVTFLIAIFFSMIITEYVIAQNSADSTIKDILTNLLNHSKNKSYEKAASFIAYSGEDKNRDLKTSFDPANKEELNQTKRICKKISALLDLSNSHEFGEIEKSMENGKEVVTAKVDFISGDQKLTTVFKFMKTDLGYLLISLN